LSKNLLRILILQSKLVKEVSKKLDASFSVNGFSRINLGEGIEKREDNLADEVAKLTQQ
jgi:elongation factor Ts